MSTELHEARPPLVHPETARHSGRRRRPTGAPPPLPRSLGWSGVGWLVLLGGLLGWVVAALVSTPVMRFTDRLDTGLLRQIARLRTGWLTSTMRAINQIGSGWTVTVLALGLVVALLVFRRWRHLFAFLGSFFVGGTIFFDTYGLRDEFTRPRPYGVTTIHTWYSSSMPSSPVAVTSLLAVAIVYSLVVPGRPRQWGKVIAAAVVGALIFARLYLAVDHPLDAVVAAAIGVAIPLFAFRWFTPNSVFPVRYGTGKTAHLDVHGPRGEAIRQAVRDQLGLTVIDAEPVGLAGSGGSTPLRLRVAGDPDVVLFAKLYAMNHVRADRWYKLGRTILYGRLEDEAPFKSVARLVQYEDYALRVMRDAGIPTATPYGIVEITPGREYILVTSFFEGAEEIGDADIDDGVIDEALDVIRKLWDAGLAHRDIKPANLLVRDGHLEVIDVAFMQVRPSPWRQAVDLANMMLVLAVRTDAERVYRRALAYFTPDEIAEAFAAARGVASPSQLRSALKSDGRDLIAEFRALAPSRRPISLQRWSVRRIALVVGLVAATAFVVMNVVGSFSPDNDSTVSGTARCGTGNVMILVAQSVPSATAVPCIASFPAGWQPGQVHVDDNRASFWLNSDRGGHHAIEVTLHPPGECDVRGAARVPTDEPGARRYERPEQLPPGLRSTRYYIFDGGCVTYRFAFNERGSASLLFDVDHALALQPRARLVDEVRKRSGLQLCGANAPACPGGTGN